MKSITHTEDSLKLTEFAQRYAGWHSYAQDKQTVAAIKRAEFLGSIEISASTHQFRSIRG